MSARDWLERTRDILEADAKRAANQIATREETYASVMKCPICARPIPIATTKSGDNTGVTSAQIDMTEFTAHMHLHQVVQRINISTYVNYDLVRTRVAELIGDTTE